MTQPTVDESTDHSQWTLTGQVITTAAAKAHRRAHGSKMWIPTDDYDTEEATD